MCLGIKLNSWHDQGFWGMLEIVTSAAVQDLGWQVALRIYVLCWRAWPRF